MVGRLWVTGVGLVTALGHDAETTWARLLRGERGVRTVDIFDTTGQRARLAAGVSGVEVPAEGKPAGAWSRTSVMARLAVKEAMGRASLAPGTPRVGLVVGATTGGMFETEALLADLHQEPHSAHALASMLSHPLTATSDRLAEAFGPFCRVRTVCSACSSGANALIVAAQWLLAGELDAVVAGGSDGLCRLTLTGFNALGAIDPEPCRPFDRRRRGLNLGEGAGFVVLERADDARRRGAAAIAELAGWALGAEAHHITNPEPDGATAAALIAGAIAHARIAAADVDYVNAHGTGTSLNDPMECAALGRALGDEIERIAVSSSKAQLGHTLGAAGAIEGIVAALTVARQAVVPTAGLDQPDDACRLLHVAHTGRRARVRAALSNSFGFGGMDSVLVFTEPELGPGFAIRPRRVVVTAAATLTPSGLAATMNASDVLAPDVAQASGSLTVDVSEHLDATRARRLDRAARMGALITGQVLADARLAGAAMTSSMRTGIVLGSAFGNVDGSAAFMHRVRDKGPRFASPADFPNLVPSSPVGHVSIYHGLRGPVLMTADLGASGESAFAQGYEFVGGFNADAVVAGGVEERSDIVERVLVTLLGLGSSTDAAQRSEGGGAVLLEAEEHARGRGARVLASVAQVVDLRAPQALAAMAHVAPPRADGPACVVVARDGAEVRRLVEASAWRHVPVRSCDRGAGAHEAVGAVAIAAAVSAIARGKARSVLTLGLAQGRGLAIVFVAP